jgi:hypothetical protein
VADLSAVDRDVLQAYRRYGTGLVSGAVMRMDLMARGLLQIRREKPGERYSYRRWERNPTERLAERAFLITPQGFDRDSRWHYGSFNDETERPLPNYAIQPTLAKCLAPAGPPSWSVTIAKNAVSLRACLKSQLSAGESC